MQERAVRLVEAAPSMKAPSEAKSLKAQLGLYVLAKDIKFLDFVVFVGVVDDLTTIFRIKTCR